MDTSPDPRCNTHAPALDAPSCRRRICFTVADASPPPSDPFSPLVLQSGNWSPKEDEALRASVARHGIKPWPTVSSGVPGRSAKQCRERWHNHLNPNVDKSCFTAEEDELILKGYEVHGTKWSRIAKDVHSQTSKWRTDNQVKNRFNSTLCRSERAILARSKLKATPPTAKTREQSARRRRVRIDDAFKQALGDADIANLLTLATAAPDRKGGLYVREVERIGAPDAASVKVGISGIGRPGNVMFQVTCCCINMMMVTEPEDEISDMLV